MIAIHQPNGIFPIMKCPHCLVEVHASPVVLYIGDDCDGQWGILSYKCPNDDCGRIVFVLGKGSFTAPLFHIPTGTKSIPSDFEPIAMVRPKGPNRNPIPSEVPSTIAQDYREACLVLHDSAKASAALSRRCLQSLLRETAGVRPGTLSEEIQQLLDAKSLPGYLADDLDAVRNIGNFAAHPNKSRSTGELSDVEPGEADWTLNILEGLFDFYFVQPLSQQRRREALNKKLSDLGKPPMKGNQNQ